MKMETNSIQTIILMDLLGQRVFLMMDCIMYILNKLLKIGY